MAFIMSSRTESKDQNGKFQIILINILFNGCNRR